MRGGDGDDPRTDNNNMHSTYNISHAHYIASTFYLSLTPVIKKIILKMTNLEDFWKIWGHLEKDR